MKNDLPERIRQFEVVAKVAIQTGAYKRGGNGRRNRISLAQIAHEFGLTDADCRKSIARAQDLLSNVSNSVSSDVLLIRARRSHRKIAPFKIAA